MRSRNLSRKGKTMSEFVHVEQKGRVLVVTLDRQEQKNALTHDMYAAMADALEQADKSDDIRALMFTAKGDMYTAGNDLGDFARPMPEGKPPVVRFLENLRDAETPVVAAVNGHAIGVGLTMLLHCDLSFASKEASFRAPFAQVGLVPEAASSMLLPQVVGMAMANDILLAGRILSAEEALNVGLVSRLYAPDELFENALEAAQSLADMAPNALKQSKKLIRANRDKIAEHMKVEGRVFSAQLASSEFMEAATAFMQKRKPVFT